MPVVAAVGGPMIASALIGGGTALAGGAMQSKASNRAAQASQAATDQSSATQRYIFDQTRADNAVHQQAGDAATRRMASLLGLGFDPQRSPQAGAAMPASMPASSPYGGRYHQVRVNALTGVPSNYIAGKIGGEADANAPDSALYNPGAYGGPTPQGGSITTGAGGVPAPQQIPENALSGAQSPTDWLRSTPGYQFNLDEGMRALNTGLAGQGRLQSGDAKREAIKYGQNYGDRIYGDQYNRLAGIAGAGQTASSANQQAGMNYANNQTSLNMNNANARASSYQNGANAWTNALGGVAGAGMWALGQYPGKGK